MGPHHTQPFGLRRLALPLSLAAAGAAAGIGTAIAIAGGGILGYDLVAYRLAAKAVLAGASPYHATQLAAPIPAIDVSAVNFLYPPIMAQLMAPLALLPMEVAQISWLTLNLVAWLAAGLLIVRAAGHRPSPAVAAAIVAVAFVFRPMLMSLSSGNVGGLMALVVAAVLVGDPRCGAAATVAGTALKLLPGLLLPAQLLRGGQPALRATLLIGLPPLLVSVALAPEAWRQYPSVVANLAAGDVDFAGNLAPSISALVLGLPELAAPLRMLTVVAAAAGLIASGWFATRPAGWPPAVALAVTAMLLAPGMIWPHYYALAAPLMLAAGLRCGWGGRCGLAAAGFGIGLVWSDPLLQPISAASGLVALCLSAWLLRPRKQGGGRYGYGLTAAAARGRYSP